MKYLLATHDASVLLYFELTYISVILDWTHHLHFKGIQSCFWLRYTLLQMDSHIFTELNWF